MAGESPQVRVINDFIYITEGESVNQESLDINELIKSAVEQYDGISTSLQADLPRVTGNRAHTGRLVTALLEYFDIQGEEITHVETRVEISQERSLFFDAIDAGKYVVISIGDNYPADGSIDLEYLFDPAVSVKLHNEHQIGFGLSVVRRVATELDGGIDLVMLDKGGIRIEIYLPANSSE